MDSFSSGWRVLPALTVSRVCCGVARARLGGVIEELSLANSSGSYGWHRFCSGSRPQSNGYRPLYLKSPGIGTRFQPHSHPLISSQHPLKAEQQQLLAQDVCPVLLALDARLLRGTKWRHELCEGTNRSVRRRGEQLAEMQHHNAQRSWSSHTVSKKKSSLSDWG